MSSSESTSPSEITGEFFNDGVVFPNDYEVTCRLHGPMRYVFALYMYVCKGFDGEGCDRTISDELLKYLEDMELT